MKYRITYVLKLLFLRLMLFLQLLDHLLALPLVVLTPLTIAVRRLITVTTGLHHVRIYTIVGKEDEAYLFLQSLVFPCRRRISLRPYRSLLGFCEVPPSVLIYRLPGLVQALVPLILFGSGPYPDLMNITQHAVCIHGTRCLPAGERYSPT